jgi:hypothetical protein
LLADLASQGLDPAESARLAALLAHAGGGEAQAQAEGGDESLERAAAALDRALFAEADARVAQEVPAHLLAALEREGQAWTAGLKAGATSNRQGVLARIGGDPLGAVQGAVTSVMDARSVRGPMVMGRRYLREWSGWLAAAACLGLAALTWNYRARPSAEGTAVLSGAGLGGGGQAAGVAGTSLLPSDLLRPVERFAEDLGLRATQRLNRFMSDPHSDLVIVPIGKARPVAEVEVGVGEVVWNRADGSGVLRLRADDPATLKGGHFQLWIFDTARNEHLPIDGGVIEVRPGQSEVLVPIDPSLPVGRAAAFVVTREPAGGSVVSSRQRMVAVGVAEGMAPPPVFEDESASPPR